MNIEVSNLLDKAWWKSKTIWVQIIGSFILAVVGALTFGLEQLDAAWAAAGLIGLGFVKDWITTALRLGTKHGIIPAKEEIKQNNEVSKLQNILLAIGDIEINEVDDIKKAVEQVRFNKKVAAAREILNVADAAKQPVPESPKA